MRRSGSRRRRGNANGATTRARRKARVSSESDLEREARTFVTRQGGLFLKLQGTAGWPDRLVLLPNGCSFFVEFKRIGGQLSPLQRHYLQELKLLGYEAFEVDNIHLFKRLVNERR